MNSDSEPDSPKPYYLYTPNNGKSQYKTGERLFPVETGDSLIRNSRLIPTSTHNSYFQPSAVANGASRPGSIMTMPPIQPQQTQATVQALQQQYGISSVKPVVDQHDRMWAELDVLDEVEVAANETEANTSFFGEMHAKVLADLQISQLELIKSMSLGDKRIDKGQYQSLWEQNDIESLRNNLFNQQHFDSIYKHVSKTIEKLDIVAEKMKEIDNESQEMWKSN
ncbi:uncharacterized protein SAPINGB_P001727 [Magnusiomyces paraingens]|uniref:Uncharacterized protein n=1 Tax=Magnusiomyces paraingens TaxID=2606893 RepID=A0A5E8B750_9ASCO|nr:uncharacterized protein SAPINGB_P001727 [Saprochaete ingens]VVT47470.1 unnamed protein product [Saprochaete ingens]